jgi:hypothetical protein
MEENEIISFRSQIDGNFIVSIVYREYEKYNNLMKVMERIGDSIAILNLKDNHIFIDGESLKDLEIDHLIAIQAHEICHSVLKHPEGVSDEYEIEADLGAIYLLDYIGYPNASILLKERLLKLRSLEYNTDLIKSKFGDIKFKSFQKYLDNIEKII